MSGVNDISSLGEKVELTMSSTNNIVERIKRDLYVHTYKEVSQKDSEEVRAHKEKINKMVESAYLSKTGRPFNYAVFKKSMPRPVWCMGPPGQGKTASFQVACKEFCEEVGFNLIREVTDDYVPATDGLDFPIVIQETAGENSAITFGGVPKAEEVEILNSKGMVTGKKTVLKRALNYRFTIFDRCAGGLVLFDDAANASAMIQNVLLPVAQNKTFQGLKIDAMIGFTGNLGALDGTHTVELSSALITRVNPYFISDNVADYVKRGYKEYNDDLGDLGFLSYLNRNPKEFAELPRTGSRAGFACPRSHSNFIEGARATVEFNGGRGKGEASSLAAIRDLAVGCYGQKYGQRIFAFYQSYLQGVDPLARAAIIDNKLDKVKVAEKYQRGTASEAMSFGYQFVTACGDYFVTEVGGLLAKKNLDRNKLNESQIKDFVESKEFKDLCLSYGKAALCLEPQEFSFGIEHIKGKLIAYAPALSVVNSNSRDIVIPFGDNFAVTINSLEECSPNHKDVLVKTITGTSRSAGVYSAAKKTSTSRSRMD